MAHSRVAAKSMLIKAQQLDVSLTNLTLHKLLYFAHGLMLARHDRALVDQPFHAWKYGPVLESLYHDLKPFGTSPVTPESWFVESWDSLPPGTFEEEDAIESILTQFGNQPAVALIEISHDSKGPWSAVYAANTQSSAIDDDQIKKYFKKHLTEL